MSATTMTVLARDPERAAGVVEVGGRFGVAIGVQAWAAAGDLLGADLVISTVPAGGVDALAEQIPGRVGTLFDVVYAPWPTPLAAAWSGAGGVVVGGLSLLVEQAAEQVRLMTGKQPPVDTMYAALAQG